MCGVHSADAFSTARSVTPCFFSLLKVSSFFIFPDSIEAYQFFNNFRQPKEMAPRKNNCKTGKGLKKPDQGPHCVGFVTKPFQRRNT